MLLLVVGVYALDVSSHKCFITGVSMSDQEGDVERQATHGLTTQVVGRLLCLVPLTHVSHNLVPESESSNPSADLLLF